MTRRRLLWIVPALLVLVVVAGIVAVLTVPRVARDLAVRHLAALTGRPVGIDALDLSLRTGEFSVRGFRLTDHDGGRLAEFDRLEGRFRPAALVRGRLALERVTLNGAHLRVVRVSPDRFNISDLLARGDGGQGLIVSVTELEVTEASIAVEDRVLTPTRTWRADGIRVTARDVTPHGRTGTAVASTTVAGALVSMRADQVNLTPLHLRAWINVRDFDLRLAALYLPADAVVLQRGTVDAGLAVTVDATDGTRLDADAVVDSLALRRPGIDGDALTAPALQVLVRDLHHRPGATSLRYASVGGDLTVLDPTTTPPRRLVFSDFTATISGLEEQRGQTRVALHANVPGGGEVDASGSVGLTPRVADVRVRARGIELAALGPYLPIAGRLEGVVGADVRVTATHEPSLRFTVAGDATLERAGLGDGTRALATAGRVAATAVEYTWPATVRVGQLTVARPAVTLERDTDGAIGLLALVTPVAPRTAAGERDSPASSASAVRPTPAFTITRLRVEDGRALLTDAASGARLDARHIALTAEELGWPSGGTPRVEASAAIGDTQVSARGTVDPARRSADVALRVRGADLATLQPWVPITGRVRGGADADVRIVTAQEGTPRVAVSGDVTLHRVALLDGTRAVAEVTRIAATGLEYTWPASIRAASLTLSQPSAIVERAGDGSIGLTALVRRSAPAPADAAQTPTAGPAATPPTAVDVAVALLRVEDGRATVTDAATGGRADLTRLGLTARDVTWPAPGDAAVQLSAAVAGGTVTARGTVDAGARRGELAVTLRGADLAALQPWLAMNGRVRGAAHADLTVRAALEPFTLVARGRAGVTSLAFLDAGQPLLTVGLVEAADAELDWPTRLSIDRLRVNAPWAKIERDARGQLSLRTLFERPPGRPAPPPAELAGALAGPLPGMQVTVRDALFENGGTSLVDDSVEPALRLDVKGTRLAVRDLTWPARGVAAVDLSTPTPGREGTLRARGSFSIEPTRLALDVDLDKVDLAPARPYLPIDARLSGRLSAQAKVTGAFGDTIMVAIDGDATADRLALGDENRRLATVRQADLKGLRYRYPTSLRVKQVTLDKPWLLVERDSAGRLELVTLVTAKRTPPPPRPSGPPATPAPTPRAPGPPGQEPSVRLLIQTLTLQDGFVRFVDRTTEPDYAEEISGITVAATGLGTRPARHGKIALQGTFASGTPLTVTGEMGGFTGPRYLDATVDVREFPMPRLNPYLMSLLGWRATSGALTASVHSRIIGDDLEATNDVTLNGLEVERPPGVAPDAGPPLDTVVSLLKNRDGLIKLSVPVHGRLSEPEFDYGEAVWAAARNLAIRLVALPFSLVGKLFFTPDSRIRAVTVDPVTFQAGRAAPTADGLEQLQQLARFLAQAPGVRLRLRPVTTVTDVAVLRREALDARLASLGADADTRRRAAVGLYAELFPRRQPPSTDEALFDELTRETPTPPRALRDLAAGRVAAVSDALARAGIAADRLERLESRAAVESEGAARVEFEIH